MDGLKIINNVVTEYKGIEGDIVIPEGIVAIGDSVFKDNHGIKRIILPTTIKNIGAEAFYNCLWLEEIVIPEGVETISHGAFKWCENLRTISLSEGLEFIGEEAFDGCLEITKIVIPQTVKVIGERAFKDMKSLRSLYFKGAVEEIADNAFKNTRLVKTDFNSFSCTEHTLPITLTRFPEITRIEAKSLGFLVLYQNSQEWKDFVDSKCFEREEEIGSEIIELLKQSTVEEDAARNVVEYVIRNGIFIRQSMVQEIYSLISKNGFETIANELKENRVTGRAFNDDNNNINPIEEFVILNLKNNACVKKIQKTIKQGVHYKDSEDVCSISVIAYAISEYESQKDKFFRDLQFKVKADRVAKALNKTELADVAKENGYYMALCRFGNENQISSFISKHEKEYDWMKALLLSDSRAAMKELDKRKRLDWYAELRETDEETLRDIVMTDVGLNSEGVKIYDLGTKKIKASLNKELQYDLIDMETGLTVSSFPSKNIDKELLLKAKNDFTLLKRNTKNMFRERISLLLAQFMLAESISFKKWNDLYRKNPILKPIAELLVWDQAGKSFIVNNNLYIDSFGNKCAIGESEYPIRIAHPIDMTEDERKRWQDYFVNNKIKQPFSQIWEAVIIEKMDDIGKIENWKISENEFNNIKKVLQKKGINTRRTTMLWSGNEITASHGDVLFLTAYYEQLDDNNLIIKNFAEYTNTKAFERQKRYINAAIFEYYKAMISTSITNDNAPLDEDLDKFTLEQIMTFIKIANDTKATKSSVKLLDYKNNKYGEFNYLDDLILDL